MWDKVPETNDSERETPMSRPAAAASQSLPFELVFEDGIPMDDFQHPVQMALCRELTHEVMGERGRKDYTVGGDNFVYYSFQQAEDVVKGRPYFRGPDFFFVDGIPFREDRRGWVAWEEGGRLPDLIVEILSPSTAHIDRKDKRDLYARVFRTREYYLVDLQKGELEGLRLAGDFYRSMRPTAEGRFRSELLGVDFGLWRGEYSGMSGTWLRFFYPDGRMVPTPQERAEAAEAEVRRLRSLLGEG
jgi:Uma2 family endonuclease